MAETAIQTQDYTYIHDLAHVEIDASIGNATKIWQFASVVRGAVVGADCVVGSGATIDGAYLGDRCHVGAGAFMPPGTYAGDDVFIGPNVTICNDEWPRVDKEGFDRKIWPCVAICRGASIGAGATILPGVWIGDRAMIAAGAVVTRCVPKNHIFRRDGSEAPIEDESARRKSRMRRYLEYP